MERIVALGLALLCLMTGCGKKTRQKPEPYTPELTVTQLVDELAEQVRLPMPLSLDDQLAHQLIGLDPDDIEEYRGYLSMDMTCPDHIIGVRAKPERAEAVAGTLEQRREFVALAYADQPEARARADAGVVVFCGDYVFLVMAGRPGEDFQEQVAQLTKAIEDNYKR